MSNGLALLHFAFLSGFLRFLHKLAEFQADLSFFFFMPTMRRITYHAPTSPLAARPTSLCATSLLLLLFFFSRSTSTAAAASRLPAHPRDLSPVRDRGGMARSLYGRSGWVGQRCCRPR